MKPLHTPESMRAFDAFAAARGTPSIVLMENAGRGATEVLVRELLGGSAAHKRVVLCAGRGNNGGDAFVVARRLLVLGAKVSVHTRAPVERLRGDALTAAEAYLGCGGALSYCDDSAEALSAFERATLDADAVVDGLYGTGLTRPVEGRDRDVVLVLSRARAKGLALDVPSGLSAATGEVLGVAVSAAHTVSFVAEKLGTATPIGKAHAGRVHVVDIGVPVSLPGLPREARASAIRLEKEDFVGTLTPRGPATHKYRAGHVAIVAGSPGKTGAALLAAHGAARAGAGATTLASDPKTVASFESRVLESMTCAITPDHAGELALDALLARSRGVVLGPGLGRDERARALVARVLATCEAPVVLDADGFAAYEGSLAALRAVRPASRATILLPHEGELGRLLGISSEAVARDRFGSVREASRRSGAIVLLKGACSLVSSSEGDTWHEHEITVVDEGSPALAVAGSGDVLAGIVAALVCTLAPRRATELGAYLHGRSGTLWGEKNGLRGLLAHEIAEGVPEVLRELE